ncbi:MAG: DinB family protein [Rhodothermales bacterium]
MSGLDDEQLGTPYREGGWSSRQVVHHLFDSHANAFIRFRLALTEHHPRITAYNEAL